MEVPLPAIKRFLPFQIGAPRHAFTPCGVPSPTFSCQSGPALKESAFHAYSLPFLLHAATIELDVPARVAEKSVGEEAKSESPVRALTGTVHESSWLSS